MKKGFTLVEIMAAVVIISLVMLIVVPKVNDVIESSQEEAFKNNVLNVFEAVTKLEATSDYRLDENGIHYDDDRLNIEKNIFTGGKIFLSEDGKVTSDSLRNEKFCALGTKKNLSILKGDCSLKGAIDRIKYIQVPNNQKWHRGKTITINIEDKNDIPFIYSYQVTYRENGQIIKSEWQQITEENTDIIFGTVDDVESIYGVSGGNIVVKVENEEGKLFSTYQVTKVDATAPENLTLKLLMRNANKMYIQGSAIENESYIKKYEFKVGNGSYENNGQNDIYKIESAESEINVGLRITNAVGDSDEVSETFSPESLVNPSIEVLQNETGKWYKEKDVKITYPMNRKDTPDSLENNYKYYYKNYVTDVNSVDYEEISPKTCTVKEDGLGNLTCEITKKVTQVSKVIATVQVGDKTAISTAEINNVDNIPPTTLPISSYVTNNEVRLHVTASDEGGSGLLTPYECSKNVNESWSSYAPSNGTVCVFSGLTSKTLHEFQVRVKDNAGNDHIASYTTTTKATNDKIKLTEEPDGMYKKVKIEFPSMGDAAVYKYRVGLNGSWKIVTDEIIHTSQIKTNGTVVTAKVEYDGVPVKENSITVNIDITKPTCSLSKPADTNWLKKGATTTYTITCTDDFGKNGYNDKKIVQTDIISSDTGVATVNGISSRTDITDGFKYTVTVKAVGTGKAGFTIKAGAIADAVGNKNNASTTSAKVKVDNTKPKITNLHNSSGGNIVYSGTIVTISGNYNDGHSGIDKGTLKYSYDRSTVNGGFNNKTDTGFSGDWSAVIDKNVWVRVADKAGNYSEWYNAGYVRIRTRSFSISGTFYSSGPYQSCTGYWQQYMYRFNISLTGYSISSGKMCYESYCGWYNSSGSTGYGSACFDSTTTWNYYRSSASVTGTVCVDNGGGCKSTTIP